ncbi:MAG: hypothetical protein AAFQ87_04155 [Bacteroidota bacterium]
MKQLSLSLVLLLLMLGACEQEQKTAAEAEVPVVRQQLQVLRLKAGAYPEKVAAGEETEIDLLVTDATGKPMANVNVEVDVPAGVFSATDKTVIVGPTNGRGEFRTKWRAPKPSLKAYKLRFRAQIAGEAEGRTDLTVMVE